jgi:hypothetical protein
VVTRFSLRKATNSGGIAYSQAQFAIDRILTPQEHALLDKLSEQVKAYSRQLAFDFDNTMDSEDGTDFSEIDPATGEIIEPLK